MWTKKDWIYLGVSATAAFGLTVITLHPSNATAENPALPAAVIDNPTLTIDGVSITAAVIDVKPVRVINKTTFIQPGPLPKMELRATNKTGTSKTVRVSADLFESEVPNFASRVPMRRADPKAKWTQEIVVEVGPNESKTIPISTDVTLPKMSVATLRLGSGALIDALSLNSTPVIAPEVTRTGPTTAPASGVAVASPGTPR